MEELEKQERYTRPFLTGTVRQHAYPFADGLPQAANLVTLLAWAEYLKTTPAVTNRYFEAKQADRLTRLERDKRRTISFSLLVPARVISGTATILSFVLAVRLLITNPEALLRPLGWWTTLLSLALGGVAFLAYGGLNMLADWQRAPSWIRQFLGGRQETSNGHIASTVPNFHSKVLFTSVAALLVFGGPVSFIVATTPLMASTPIPFYVAVEILGPLICFWLPIVDGFTGQMRYHLYRPNPYVDAYDDPRSRHWLVPSITSSPTTE
jgi:hypothetical protein